MGTQDEDHANKHDEHKQQVYDDEDPRQAHNYVSSKNTFDTSGPRGFYDQAILNEAIPKDTSDVLYEDKDLDSEEMRALIRQDMEDRPEQMRILRRDYAPVQFDNDDCYSPINLMW